MCTECACIKVKNFHMKGGSGMGNAERRSKIIKILRIRKYDRIFNLACELGVSTRSIRRDIQELSLTEPIYTQCGRYTGGVYYLDAYYDDYILISKQEAKVFRKILEISKGNDTLTKNDIHIIADIETRFDKY